VDDVYALMSEKISLDDNAEAIISGFGERMAEVLRTRLNKDAPEYSPGLRLSGIGQCAAKQWYDVNDPTKEEMQPHTLIKFLFGDVIEEMLLALVKLSGHEVTGEQDSLVLEGVRGHRDCVIDGYTVDVKSASRYGFEKFVKGTIKEDDPFGYMCQKAAYMEADPTVKQDAAFNLVMHKELGKLCLYKTEAADLPSAKDRVNTVRASLDQPTPPPRPYEAVPQTAKNPEGNKKLPSACSYCRHKFKCWDTANDGEGLRTFLYSFGPVYLTDVVSEPRVEELP
jgi:hypothetical protein